MKKQVVVMGLGRFGFSVAATLQSLGHDVLALDDDEKNVAAAASLITRAVQADSTNESVLREMGVPGCDVAIVSMGVSIEASVLSTILAKKLGVPVPPSAPEAGSGRRGVTNKRINSRKLREELGYRFRYPTFREGYMEDEVKSAE